MKKNIHNEYSNFGKDVNILSAIPVSILWLIETLNIIGNVIGNWGIGRAVYQKLRATKTSLLDAISKLEYWKDWYGELAVRNSLEVAAKKYDANIPLKDIKLDNKSRSTSEDIITKLNRDERIDSFTINEILANLWSLSLENIGMSVSGIIHISSAILACFLINKYHKNKFERVVLEKEKQEAYLFNAYKENNKKIEKKNEEITELKKYKDETEKEKEQIKCKENLKIIWCEDSENIWEEIFIKLVNYHIKDEKNEKMDNAFMYLINDSIEIFDKTEGIFEPIGKYKNTDGYLRNYSINILIELCKKHDIKEIWKDVNLENIFAEKKGINDASGDIGKLVDDIIELAKNFNSLGIITEEKYKSTIAFINNTEIEEAIKYFDQKTWKDTRDFILSGIDQFIVDMKWIYNSYVVNKNNISSYYFGVLLSHFNIKRLKKYNISKVNIIEITKQD